MQNISRRKFLAGGAVLTVGAVVGCFRGNPLYREAKETLNILSDGDIRFIRQVMGKTPDTRIIVFEGVEPLTGARVRLKNEAGDLTFIEPSYTYFIDNDKPRHQYEATLNDLISGQTYEYRIITDNGASEWISFKTPSEDKFTALIFPDSQSADYSSWENLAQSAYEFNKDADFFVNMGDLVDNGQDHTQWEAWFRALDNVEEHIPCAPVLGNHECYDYNWKERLPESYLKYFPVPTNASENFDRYYYSFDAGPCHFMVLSTEWNEIDPFKQGLKDEEVEWLQKDAVQTSKPWKIVMMHRDVLQYRISKRPERKEGFSDAGMTFMPLFDKLNIDIVFTAHLHTYRNRGIIRDWNRSEKGPYYILTGLAGDVRYPNLWTDHALDVAVAPQPETDNYLVLRVDNNSANIKCYRDDGKLIDDIKITR